MKNVRDISVIISNSLSFGLKYPSIHAPNDHTTIYISGKIEPSITTLLYSINGKLTTDIFAYEKHNKTIR